jgi:hypothetical protein
MNEQPINAKSASRLGEGEWIEVRGLGMQMLTGVR